MKKTFKALIAVILALVIVSSSFTAFAAEKNGSLIWNEAEYVYAGDVTEGENTVEIVSDGGVYYTFDAAKPGYYMLKYDWRDISRLRSPIIGDSGDIEDERIFEYLEDDDNFDTDAFLFFFDEGENIIAGFAGYESTAGDVSEIEVIYCGEKVTDISFEGGTEFFLVPGWNISEYYHGDEKGYPEQGYYLDGGKTDITFDSGKTLSLLYHDFVCTAENEPVTGENSITVYFINETFDKTVSVYPISRELSVEVENIEKYLDVPVAYNGNLLYDFDGMRIKLTYSDGYTETLTAENGEWFGIDLRNGNPHYFPLNYFHETVEDKVYFCLTVGDEVFVREEGTLRDATKKENRQHLNYRIYEILDEAIWDIRYNFEEISWADNFMEKVFCLRRAIFDSADDIFTAFEEIIAEIAYCSEV